MIVRKIFAWLLFPLTIWYAIGVAMRNLLFFIGILKERTHRVTTIGVGNLCVGGAGKTPHVDYLLKKLKNDYRVATLSRGYRRATKGFVLAGEGVGVSDIGDEPYMLYKRNADVQVAVCENRNLGIEKLLAQPEPPQIVILDDAFQHRYVKPTVNILLTEYGSPFFSDHTLPFGNLREPRRGYGRAGIIIVTKTPPDINPIDRYAFRQKIKAKPHQQVYFTSVEYQNPLPLHGGLPPVELAGLKSVLFVSGIANPQPAIDMLSANAKVEHLAFADHHKFTKEDCAFIADTFDRMPDSEKIILTTEKDSVRLLDSVDCQIIERLPIYYLPITVKFLGKDGDEFSKMLEKSIKENLYYLSASK